MRTVPENDLTQLICSSVEKNAEEIVEFTRQLLRIPTVNHPPSGDEKPGQDFLRKKLDQLEMEVDWFQPDEIPNLNEHPAYHPNGSSKVKHEYQNRPNLVGRWKGTGSENGRSLIIAGHMDVVPPGDSSAWSYDPWGAEISPDGKIYARGAIDNKGPLAAAVMAVAILQGIGIKLDGDLILESVVDEEFGGGNGTLTTILRGYHADGVISVEPSSLAVCPTTLGCVSISLMIEGLAAHGIEQWKGANPIGSAVTLYQALPKWHQKRNQLAQKYPLLAVRPIPLPLICRTIIAGANLGGASIPADCQLNLWLGIAPEEKWNDVETELQQFISEVANSPEWTVPQPAKYQKLGRFLEGSQIPNDHPLSQVLMESYFQVNKKKARLECGTSGDLFIYTNYARIPGLICGPGNLFLAHGIDEFIPIKDLLTAVKVYAIMITKWCGLSD